MVTMRTMRKVETWIWMLMESEDSGVTVCFQLFFVIITKVWICAILIMIQFVFRQEDIMPRYRLLTVRSAVQPAWYRPSATMCGFNMLVLNGVTYKSRSVIMTAIVPLMIPASPYTYPLG